MRPQTSKDAFEAFVLSQRLSIGKLTPAEGVTLMLEFYRRVRAEGVVGLDQDGDMLLYEWGTFDWGRGKNFELGITRQFIDAELQDDDAISQLRLLFHFAPTEELLRLKDGGRWCDQPRWLSELELFIHENSAYQTVATTMPEEVELVYSRI